MAYSSSNTSKLQRLQKEFKKTKTTLVAVSKTQTKESILELYDAGQRIFGENRVQELVAKNEELPDDIEWHFIGSLQRKKVKQLIPFVSLIHSVDSIALLEKINSEATKQSKKVNVLLQFYIATETTKQGLTLSEIEPHLKKLVNDLKSIRIIGVMGMASFVNDRDQIQKEFAHLKEIFDHMKSHYFSSSPDFKTISMGMSGDYKIAIEEGSTMVRIGSLLFGT